MPISPMRIRLAGSQRSHCGVHLPDRLLTELDRADRTARLQSVDLEREVAEVEVEEVAVDAAGAADDVERGRQLWTRIVVDLVLLVDERLLNGLEVVRRCSCSSGRLSASRSATVPAASLMCAVPAASGSARFFSPVISFSKLSTVSSNCCWCLTVVSSTVFRFLITSPIAWSRSASADGQLRGLVEDVVDGAALALEDRDDRLARCC